MNTIINSSVKPLKITEAAQQEIRQILDSKQIPAEYALRVGLKGSGCGASYLLGFDQASPADELYEIDGIRVLIDRKHLMYLMGIELDFEAGDEGQGFTFGRT